MMKNTKIFLITCAFLIVASISATNAQAHFKIGESKDNSMKMSGTSTFHDWTMQTTSFTGKADFITDPGIITALKSLEFSLPVTKFKSDKKALDKNAYKALKTKQFKTIDYKMISAKISGDKDYKYQVATLGKLTVSGVTKDVMIDINCTPNKNGSITCEGSYVIKMTDYNVEPPSFMGGVMTTGDLVTLQFSMRFER